MKWLMAQKIEHREQRIAFEELLDGIRQESERIERLENAIREAVPEWSLAEVVVALQAVRGIDLIAAVGVLAELGCECCSKNDPHRRRRDPFRPLISLNWDDGTPTPIMVETPRRNTAEAAASEISLPENVKFQRARKLVRDALIESGIAPQIDALVARILGS